VVASKTEQPGIVATPEIKKLKEEIEESSSAKKANESQDY